MAWVRRSCARCGRVLHHGDGKWLDDQGVRLDVQTCAMDPLNLFLCSVECKEAYCARHLLERKVIPEEERAKSAENRPLLIRRCGNCEVVMYYHVNGRWKNPHGHVLAARLCEEGPGGIYLCSETCKLQFCRAHPDRR